MPDAPVVVSLIPDPVPCNFVRGWLRIGPPIALARMLCPNHDVDSAEMVDGDLHVKLRNRKAPLIYDLSLEYGDEEDE